MTDEPTDMPEEFEIEVEATPKAARSGGLDYEAMSPGEAVALASPRLTGAQRRWLRAEAHHLKPIVRVGERGLHEGVLAQIDQALVDHELVKVKILGGTPPVRREMAIQIHRELNGQVAQILGNIVLVYRANPDEPRLVLPGAKPEKKSKERS